MKELVAKFAECRVLVVGDYMLDEYVYGRVERISPEAPVPVVVEQQRSLVPGGAGNVVRNLRALRADVRPVGLLGQDEPSEILLEMFSGLGVTETRGLLQVPERPTTRKTRILAGNQQVCRLDREASAHIDDLTEARLRSICNELMDGAQAVILSDYDKGVVLPGLIDAVTNRARALGLFTAVDPQVSHFHTYVGVDVLTPNHHEAGRFLGRRLEEDPQIETAGTEIVERLGARMLLITRGEKGMSLFERGTPGARHFPTQALQVFDVTGAGDTVISLFTLAMACGATPEQAVLLSNFGAGLVVGQVGAAVVTPEDLAAF